MKKVKGEGPEAFVDTRLPAKTTLAEACQWILDEMGPKENWKFPNDKNKVSKWKWWMTNSPFKRWKLDKITDLELIDWVEKITAIDVGDDEEDMAEIFELEGSYAIVSTQTIVHRLNALSVLYQRWRRANRLTEAQIPSSVVSARPLTATAPVVWMRANTNCSWLSPRNHAGRGFGTPSSWPSKPA